MGFLDKIITACVLALISNVCLANQFQSLQCDNLKRPLIQCQLKTLKPAHFRYFYLKNPDRLVIDLFDMQSYPRPHITLNYAPVEHLRYRYIQQDQRFRLVFELKKSTPAYVDRVELLNQSGQLLLQFYKNQNLPRYVSLPEPSVTRILPDSKHQLGRKIVVVIDPGHGGKDPGAHGPDGAKEKNIVLEISKKLTELINQEPGYKAVLTRNGDYYLSLRQRLAVARRYKPDLFIAIHADAYPKPTAQGAGVYALSTRGATSEAARWLADNENASELDGGLDLSGRSYMIKSVLLDLSQTMTVRTSLQMGSRLISALGNIGPLHHSGVEQAAFVVLKSPDIPSLLIETGFVTTPQEEEKLISPKYQQRLAAALKNGIGNYFQAQPPRNSWLSMQKQHGIFR